MRADEGVGVCAPGDGLALIPKEPDPHFDIGVGAGFVLSLCVNELGRGHINTQP
jgi:hypothetical protein